MRTGAALAALAVMMAGCATPAATPAGLDADPGDAPPGSPAPAEGAPASPARSVAPAAVNRTEPFAWDGRSSAAVCVPNLMGGCVGVSPGSGDGMHAFGTAPVQVNLDLTWTPAAGGSEELVFVLYDRRSCGDECWEGEAIGRVSGRSPLHLEAAWVPREDRDYVLVVGPMPRTPSPAMTFLNTDQPFHVEGTLTFAAA